MRLPAIVGALAVAAAAFAAKPLQLKVDDFMELKVSGPLNVDYVNLPDSAGTVVISGVDDTQFSWVEVNGKGKKVHLALKVPPEMGSIPSNLPSVTVYSSYLTRVENEGDSTVRVVSTANVAEFSAQVMGNGRLGVHSISAGNVTGSLLTGRGVLALTGKCNNLSLRLNGTGTIQADALQSVSASLWVAGTGSVGVWATDRLSIKGVGSSTVYVVGTPELVKKAPGVKVQPIE